MVSQGCKFIAYSRQRNTQDHQNRLDLFTSLQDREYERVGSGSY